MLPSSFLPLPTCSWLLVFMVHGKGGGDEIMVTRHCLLSSLILLIFEKKKHLHLLANYAPNHSRNQFHTQADVPLVSIPEILNYSFQFIVNIKKRTHDIWGYFMSNYVFSGIKVDVMPN